MGVGDAGHYPVEFLHGTLNPPGGVHRLHLKVGIPITLLRNIRPPELCNGIRLQGKALAYDVKVTSTSEVETVFIPSISRDFKTFAIIGQSVHCHD